MIVKTNIIQQFKNIRECIALFWVKMQWETPKGENKWCFCGIHCVHVRIISVARKFIIIILQLLVVTCRPFIFSGWMSCVAEKKQSSAHLLHQQTGCYDYYCDYFTFSFQAICTVPSLCELYFSLHLWVGAVRYIHSAVICIIFIEYCW